MHKPSNGVRIRIGSVDTTVEPGKAQRRDPLSEPPASSFTGRNQDQLYWNATGTGPTFPRRLGGMVMTLPESETSASGAVYTGL